MSETLKIAILFGSYRQDTNGLRVLKYMMKQAKARGHEVHTINAREIGLPMLDRMYKEYEPGQAPEAMEKLAALYKSVDGFLIIAGEYNHSVQPGLSNLLDHFLEEYAWRPSGIVSYSVGGFGGMRVAMHLRAMLCELGMSSIPSILAISGVHNTLTEAGEDSEGKLRTGRFLDEFEWYARALKQERQKGTPY